MFDHKPLVSCIMPTAGREFFIPRAISYYQRQDYPNKELVIIDDGIIPIQHLIPDDTTIRYVRLNSLQQTTGTKRNYACDVSNGEIIVHLDDDDWYAFNWISHQVKILQSTGADICGLSQLYFFAFSQKKCWKYVYPAHEKPWVAGASMAYIKEYWESHPFKNVKIGEDNMFVWDSRPKVAAHSYIEGLVALIHPKNTSPKSPHNNRWKPTPLSVIENILGNDMSIYTVDLMR